MLYNALHWRPKSPLLAISRHAPTEKRPSRAHGFRGSIRYHLTWTIDRPPRPFGNARTSTWKFSETFAMVERNNSCPDDDQRSRSNQQQKKIRRLSLDGL